MATHLDDRDLSADFDAGLRLVELGIANALLQSPLGAGGGSPEG